MMNNPRVSILCLTYNQEKYISQALDSFLMQKTNFDYEIIVHDDASSDNTINIINEYHRKYPNIIKPLFEKENQYSKGVRGVTVKMSVQARGKYIAICEGDDYWSDPNKLQSQTDFLEANIDFAMCFTKVGVLRNDVIDGNEHKNYYKHILADKTVFSIEDILKDNFIATCSVMYRKISNDSYPDWFKELPFGDWGLHVCNALHGKIGYIDNLMAIYRVHDGGVWSSAPIHNKYLGILKFYELVNQHLDYKYNDLIIKRLSDIVMQYVDYSSLLIEAKHELLKQLSDQKVIVDKANHDLSQIRENLDKTNHDLSALRKEVDMIHSSLAWKMINFIKVKILDKIITNRAQVNKSHQLETGKLPGQRPN